MATIRQLSNGNWHVQVRIAGHRQASKVFRTKAQAKAWAVKTEDQIRSGTYLDTRQTDAIALADHLEWYLATITPRKAPSALKRERSRIDCLGSSRALSRKTIGTLSPESVVSFVDERLAAGMCADTIRKELGTLSTAVDAGVALRGFVLPRGNPVEQAKRVLRFTRSLPPGRQRNRRLSAEEEALLLDNLPPWAALAVRILLMTALRREELRKIQPNDIAESTLYVRPGKTPARTIPILPLCRELLKQWVLVNYRSDSLTQAFSRTCKSLNINDLRIHDLRHEATSRFFEQGLTIEQVALITGHSDWKSLKRYTNLRPEDLASIIGK